jgi:predicted GIY-YIG superfamily endonuclease
MYHVYLIKSINFPEKIYVVYTTNLKQRLATNNTVGSVYTSNYKQWELVMHQLNFKHIVMLVF